MVKDSSYEGCLKLRRLLRFSCVLFAVLDRTNSLYDSIYEQYVIPTGALMVREGTKHITLDR